MASKVFKQILIIILSCIALVLILALIFYQYMPSNKVIPAKVQAYSTPETIKSEVEEDLGAGELIGQTEMYEITDEDLDRYKSTKSYNPGKSDPFAAVVSESGEGDEGSSTTPSTKKSKSSTTEEGGSDNQSSSKVDRNTTDNYYSAANIGKGTK